MPYNFKAKLKVFFKLIREPKIISALLSQRVEGYLFDSGWFTSFKLKLPVDINENPIPWLTYSSIDFLSNRLTKELNILEFGSGNSTFYFASKTKSVTSIEHNQLWYNKLKIKLPSNAKILFSDESKYEEILENLSDNFDIILIDGIRRNECIKKSYNYLSKKGIIILDDSEREEYFEGIDFLYKNGFKEITFTGISPGLLYKKSTTIFYRTENCFGI